MSPWPIDLRPYAHVERVSSKPIAAMFERDVPDPLDEPDAISGKCTVGGFEGQCCVSLLLLQLQETTHVQCTLQ